MNVIVYSTAFKLLEQLEKTAPKEYTIIPSTNLGDLHYKLFNIEQVDLLIKTEEMLPKPGFNIANKMFTYKRYFPYVEIDLRKILVLKPEDLIDTMKKQPMIPIFEDTEFLDFFINTAKEMKMSKYLIKEKQDKKINLFDKIENSTEISATTKNLFSFFKKNKNQPLPIDIIADFLWGDTSEKRKKTVYVYIHELRRLLGDDTKNPKILVREKKGHYLLRA